MTTKKAAAPDGLTALRQEPRLHEQPGVRAALESAAALAAAEHEAEAALTKAARELEAAEERATYMAFEGHPIDMDALTLARRQYGEAASIVKIHAGARTRANARLAEAESVASAALQARIDAEFEERQRRLDTVMLEALQLHNELLEVATFERTLLGSNGSNSRLRIWGPLGMPGQPSGYLQHREWQRAKGFSLPDTPDGLVIPEVPRPEAVDRAGWSNAAPARVVVRSRHGLPVMTDEDETRIARPSAVDFGLIATALAVFGGWFVW